MTKLRVIAGLQSTSLYQLDQDRAYMPVIDTFIIITLLIVVVSLLCKASVGHEIALVSKNLLKCLL